MGVFNGVLPIRAGKEEDATTGTGLVMDGALRGSIRKSFGIAVVVALLGVAFVVHGSNGSRSARPAASHSSTTISASNLLRAASTASAGIYMQFDGITGAPGLGYANYPHMDSFQFGVNRSISGGTANRVIGTPRVSEITLSHATDKFSAPLLQASLTGTGTGNAVIYFTNLNVSGTLVKYLEFDVTNAALSSFSMSSGGTTPFESISLNFTAFTMIAHIAGSPAQTVSYTIP
ncbi:MAG TPA: type VI secretion system tube protein Hcp [Acidimicrobiia bacterium]